MERTGGRGHGLRGDWRNGRKEGRGKKEGALEDRARGAGENTDKTDMPTRKEREGKRERERERERAVN